MKSKFGKALLFSAAAFGVSAFVATNTPAHAASVKVTSNRALSNNVNSRNYLANGSNALYNKAGALKGARVVASKTTLSGLRTKGDSGQSYFRGYRVAKLSNGSYYMKVVSFDKHYRGWIYVGKSNAASNTQSVSGGLNYTQTFKQGSVSSDVSGATYNFKSTPLTYTQPDWTQYKVGRNTKSTSASTNDSLKVTGIGTKTNGRDSNATYYFVEDANTPAANGWIKASDVVKAGQSVVNKDQVKVNYVDGDGNTVSSQTFTNPNYQTQSAANYLGTSISGQVVSAIPSGYSAPSDASANNAAIAAAQYGGEVNFTVTKNQANLFSVAPQYSVTVNTKSYNSLPGDPVGQDAVVTGGLNSTTGKVTEKMSAKLQKLAAATTTNATSQSATFTNQQIFDALKSAGLDDFYVLEYTGLNTNQTVSTASATGQPNIAGLFGGTNSLGGSSDLTSLLGSAGSLLSGSDTGSGLSSILSGVGGALGDLANSILGGTISYRVVEISTSASALPNNVKLGSTVTIPYTVTSTKAFKFDSSDNASAADKAAAKVFLNQGTDKNTYQPNDLSNLYSVVKGITGTDDNGTALADSSFTSSTTSIDSLLNQITQ
ncbi:hypothetical protein [Lentilactobacillus sp. SPB1-3]|uniref:Uncharacterized protein n=1 Tax=Lentilactobacillus terminaliae TaxID=3003483 RepID=A0ACD5DEF8_9LACO|nr:hypothetical protein [Lentilactobacillus sp. SPB1-3]MCZ0977639.1 hypothetical protein [Lentilactobacillus sp. SPB1-3]